MSLRKNSPKYSVSIFWLTFFWSATSVPLTLLGSPFSQLLILFLSTTLSTGCTCTCYLLSLHSHMEVLSKRTIVCLFLLRINLHAPFCQTLCIILTLEKSCQNMWSTSAIFSKTLQSELLLNGGKTAQSGHPVRHQVGRRSLYLEWYYNIKTAISDCLCK
jgi:hypothetical protein